MKKTKKIVALGLTSLMSVSLLAGCSVNGLALYGAFSKSQAVKYRETKSDISLNVSATNLSTEEQQINAYLPLINSSKLSISTKSNTNDDKTASQAEADVSMMVAGTSINSTAWVNADFSQGKNIVKEIVKMPDILSAQPEFKGKEYFVMDLSQLSNTPGAVQLDYSKLEQFTKTFEPKLYGFADSYVKQYNPNLNIITKLDSKSIEVFGKSQNVNVYELKLDDKTFKELIKYTVKNFGDNKEAVIAFLKDYLLAVDSLTQSMGQPSNLNIQELINSLSKELPGIIDQVNQGLNTIDNVKLLGDKGIDIQYAVNNDGYIVNEKGTVQFVFDFNAIRELSKNANSTDKGTMPDYTGLYTITVDFNNDINILTTPAEIVFPETNSSNSISYFDLINDAVKGNGNGTNSIDEKYKNAYDAVKQVTKLATDYNVRPSFFKFEGSLEAGTNDSQAVANAASKGLQESITNARSLINALPDSLLNQKQTLSSILDNYENPIYERTVYIISSNKDNPKQADINMARTLIKHANPAYKNSYSSALDELQGKLLNNASKLVDKAVATNNQADIDNAKKAIEDLKTLPAEFSSNEITNFINSLVSKLNK